MTRLGEEIGRLQDRHHLTVLQNEQHLGAALQNLQITHSEHVKGSPERARTLAGFKRAFEELVRQHRSVPEGLYGEDLMATGQHAEQMREPARALKEQVKLLQGRVPEGVARTLRSNTQRIQFSIDETIEAARRQREEREETVMWMRNNIHTAGTALHSLMLTTMELKGDAPGILTLRQLVQDLIVKYHQRPPLRESSALAELRNAAEYAEEVNRHVRRFRGALAGIRGSIPDQEHAMIDRRARQLEGHLQFVQEGVWQATKSVFDVSEVMRERALGNTYRDKNGNLIKLELRQLDPVLIEMDRRLVERIIDNFLMDATIHPEPNLDAKGKPRQLRLAVSILRRGKSAVIRVSTIGAKPLTREIMTRIGREEFTTRAGDREGHGLGKKEAADIAKKYGGKLVPRNLRGWPTLEVHFPAVPREAA